MRSVMPLSRVSATRTWLTVCALRSVAASSVARAEGTSVQLLERWYDMVASRYPELGARLDERRPALRDPWGGALNGQPKRQQIVRDLRSSLDIQHAIETGSQRGSSTESFDAAYRVATSTADTTPR